MTRSARVQPGVVAAAKKRSRRGFQHRKRKRQCRCLTANHSHPFAPLTYAFVPRHDREFSRGHRRKRKSTVVSGNHEPWMVEHHDERRHLRMEVAKHLDNAWF